MRRANILYRRAPSPAIRGLWALLANRLGAMAAAGLIAACGTLPHKAVPESLANAAIIPGLAGLRAWGDEAPANLEAYVADLAGQLRQRHAQAVQSGEPVFLDHLALSGGGEYGAFGAGLLVGWSARGTRPEFQTVAGVSTGAIIAPLVFLGPRYDPLLTEFFTATPLDGGTGSRFLAVVSGISLPDSNPLATAIRRSLTQEMLDEIGREHRKGRRLLIGTTNLNAGRPVIWDIGTLANSGHPRALDLFHRILIASSAIPGVFAPVLFDVEAEGRRYDELHVDGGITTQVFLYPAQIQVGKLFAGQPFKSRLYVVRNRKLTPDYQETIDGIFSISARAVDTLTRNQGMGDLYQIHAITQRDGIDYNLAYIPSSFGKRSKGLFDQDYMRDLFDFGRELGKTGYSWSKSPPGIAD